MAVSLRSAGTPLKPPTGAPPRGLADAALLRAPINLTIDSCQKTPRLKGSPPISPTN